jgi:putative redox protein
MARATVKLIEGVQAVIHIRDFTLISDEPISDGGSNLGPSPKELLVAALGACAAMTARMYADRKGWALESVEVDASTDRFAAADYPLYSGDAGFVHEFRQRIVFKGDLTLAQKERLLEIAARCPVHRALTEPNVMLEELVDEIIAGEV